MSRPGYPDYHEIISDRERKRQQEMEGGRQRTLKTMAEGLIERLKNDMKLTSKVELDCSDSEPRNWKVTVVFDDTGTQHTESFWDFPSNELKTIQMLLGK